MPRARAASPEPAAGGGQSAAGGGKPAAGGDDAGVERLETALFAGCITPAPVARTVGRGRVAIFTAARPASTSVNEDGAAVIHCGPSDAVLVVADGMGGHPAGEQASRVALETFVRRLRVAREENAALDDAVILDTIAEANRRIQETCAGSGTTIAVAHIHVDQVRFHHCGDSPGLLLGSQGDVKLRTVDHSPVGEAVEKGILTPEQGIRHADRHVISNYVGYPGTFVDSSPFVPLAPGDTVVLATDGLSDNLLDDEIAALAVHDAIDQAVCNLVAIAGARMENRVARIESGMPDPDPNALPGKPDDLTVVAYRHPGNSGE